MNEVDAAPELPDDMLIDRIRFPARIRNALNEAGVKTVGEIREAPDRALLSLQNLGKGSLSYLRKTLGRRVRLPLRPARRPD
ncbi:DNA-directed RNA polymerase subunit alpha C-terminal domain-containing protein [Bradyrhizobium sp. JYMT SZCCT0428]|uniref:DNA-directed RNA polymerase subunit alpha C-terminal domain-containing protein n=1 Tax=Bradyrhizobium sp. JYMT SZCCT0428 TaxID=2807673 RepID=UPI001BAB2FCC|nr:DNA-directed RNA polymerase subunit alpha C-terminal domain-containing protein [Bradyrhizobium sp. JYMT SZCCT0428]MBR1154611.1 hypothetical protein [Bradyrhizobium sp. JYMT SZCCT0428]